MRSATMWAHICGKLVSLAEKVEEHRDALAEAFPGFCSRPPEWAASSKPEKLRLIFSQFYDQFITIHQYILAGHPEQALKQLRSGCQKILSGVTAVDEFLIACHMLRAFLNRQLETWVNPQDRAVLAETLNDFWMLVQQEALQAHLKLVSQVLLAKNRESSVLFHTIQSVATDLDLESLLSKVVFHASMLMRGKQVYLFIAGPKPADSREKPRLVLRAWNRVGQAVGEYSLRWGEGPVGQAAENQAPVVDNQYGKSVLKLPFLNNALRILAVPITFSEEILGVLLASEERRSERFTSGQRELFLMYAQQIGVAFKNVLLYQEQTRFLRELEFKNQMLESQADMILRKSAHMTVLNEVSEKINSSLDLQEVLNLLTRQAAESIGVNRCLVWLFDEKKVRLEAVAAYGFPSEHLDEMTMHLADIRDSLFFKCLSAQKPRLIPDGEDEAFFRNTLHGLLSIKCMMAVPLILKEETIGMLVVDDTREEHEFLDDEQTLVSAIANHTVMAIENARLYLKVKEQAITDGLTGVYNHRFFQLRLADEFANSKRYTNDLALIMLDIDHFKRYNDTYGHIAGDLALKEIAQLTKASVRENDIVSRYGGEEFVIILPMTNLEGARIVAERIRTAVMECKFLGDMNAPQVSISVSCGVSAYNRKMENREDLVREADTALYQAKETGRNKTVLYAPEMSGDPTHF